MTSIKDRMRALTYSFDSRKVMEQTIIPEIERLETNLAKARRDAREKCVAACEAEKVNYEDTKHPEDKVYNQAVDDCIGAITRALKEKE